jgi:hypothetical protein
MQRITPWLWLAAAGALLQLVAINLDFYTFEGEAKDAWFGVPHASGLILLSAGVAIVFLIALAANRQPLRGRAVGLWVGLVGLAATFWIGYRMLVPPFGETPGANNTIGLFGSCYFFCLPGSDGDAPADVLFGMWLGFVGCISVAVGGLAHAFSRKGRETPANPTIAREQGGMTPYLGVAALGSVAMFVFGYTIFTFYTTTADDGGAVAWSGWVPTPQTGNMVLLGMALVLGLVWFARRERSPASPAALGGIIAAIGAVVGIRILFRIIEPPFGDGADIGLAAYLSLLGALAIVAAGIAQAIKMGSTAGGEARSASPTAADPA